MVHIHNFFAKHFWELTWNHVFYKAYCKKYVITAYSIIMCCLRKLRLRCIHHVIKSHLQATVNSRLKRINIVQLSFFTVIVFAVLTFRRILSFKLSSCSPFCSMILFCSSLHLRIFSGSWRGSEGTDNAVPLLSDAGGDGPEITANM